MAAMATVLVVNALVVMTGMSVLALFRLSLVGCGRTRLGDGNGQNANKRDYGNDHSEKALHFCAPKQTE